jgi:hypothetical protein
MLICVITYYCKSGGGTWGTSLYTVRCVGSGSRDVEACRANGLYVEDRGLCLVPVTPHQLGNGRSRLGAF